MRKLGSLVAVSVLFAACAGPSSGPEVISATQDGVTVGKIQSDKLPAATSLAQLECRKYGKDARRVTDFTAGGSVQYSCVEQ